MNIIETKNLTKSYADFTAVSGVNLHIPKGTVYGFLGPNGAGKSTTMKMFLGLTKPTSGSFVIDGKKYPENRVEILKEVGSFIEAPAFYGNLSGEENLDLHLEFLFGKLFGKLVDLAHFGILDILIAHIFGFLYRFTDIIQYLFGLHSVGFI